MDKISWENAPANAGDKGLIPGLGRSTCFRVTKPMHHSYCVPQLLKPACLRAYALQQDKHHNEKPVQPQLKGIPSLLQLEKAHVQQADPVQPKRSQ